MTARLPPGLPAALLPAILLLAACAAAPPVPEAPAVIPGLPSCTSRLGQSAVVFRPLESRRTPQGCSVEDSVSLIRATVDLSAPVVLACDFTLKWLDFETQVLQPAARRHFGRGVKRVDHMGGYACRPVAGTARLSQHAHGMAFDIAGFVLEDGRRVGVKQAWGGDTPAGRFLREIAAEGCRLFSLVLTPASDAAHHDHLHFELGPWRRCG